jgi:hypothetical protein
MHTDSSLSTLDDWTTTLGEDARMFVELTCAEFSTKESKREYEKRKRREARNKSKKQSASALVQTPGESSEG